MLRLLAIAGVATLMTATAASALPCWDGIKDTCTPPPPPKPPVCVPDGDEVYCSGTPGADSIVLVFGGAGEKQHVFDFKQGLIAKDWQHDPGTPATVPPWVMSEPKGAQVLTVQPLMPSDINGPFIGDREPFDDIGVLPIPFI